MSSIEEIKQKIRHIPDFPKPGILFYDLTTLLGDPQGYQQVIDLLGHRYIGRGIEVVVGIEARGFIVAAALAYKLGAGLVPVRKPGKLPYETHSFSYDLEYGTDELQIHQDAVKPGQRVVVIDDLIATGGTMKAAASLIEKLEGTIVELACLVELIALQGRERLKEYQVYSLIQF